MIILFFVVLRMLQACCKHEAVADPTGSALLERYAHVAPSQPSVISLMDQGTNVLSFKVL